MPPETPSRESGRVGVLLHPGQEGRTKGLAYRRAPGALRVMTENQIGSEESLMGGIIFAKGLL